MYGSGRPIITDPDPTWTIFWPWNKKGSKQSKLKNTEPLSKLH
jgi:hypothetical protein